MQVKKHFIFTLSRFLPRVFFLINYQMNSCKDI